MTDENAIKYLKQLYPNGGHCWLDEQRIEAIGIAISAIEFKEKVRAEIERLRKSFKVISVASPSKDTTLENIAKAALCKQILSFIDSMQKEPIGKVWHYQKEEPIDEITDKSRPIVVIYGYNSLNAASKFRCYEDNSEAIWLSNHYEKWAFIEDLINLSQSVKTSDQEEPAPKIFEDMLNAKTPAESLGISQEEHDRIVDGLIYGKEPEMVDIDDLPKEEPVSEELESWDKFSHIDDAIEDYCRYDSHIVFFTESLNGEPLEEADDREQVESAFKAGAQWQKRKDKQNFKELAVLASHQDGCLALENIQMRLNELIKED